MGERFRGEEERTSLARGSLLHGVRDGVHQAPALLRDRAPEVRVAHRVGRELEQEGMPLRLAALPGRDAPGVRAGDLLEGAVGRRGLHIPHQLVDAGGVQREEEVVLAAEVGVDRAFGEPGGVRDVVECSCGEAALEEQLARGFQQALARLQFALGPGQSGCHTDGIVIPTVSPRKPGSPGRPACFSSHTVRARMGRAVAVGLPTAHQHVRRRPGRQLARGSDDNVRQRREGAPPRASLCATAP
jgi:hypothetical protein